jgi:hypothetical protein
MSLSSDNVLGFQHQAEADRFLEEFRERLRKFGLELHPDKTRRIEFGRFAEINRNKRGEGKPETFDFLGFKHISGKDREGPEGELCGEAQDDQQADAGQVARNQAAAS